jgi:hypothetical protein
VPDESPERRRTTYRRGNDYDPGNGLALLAALDRLRDDFREDLAALEGRMKGAIAVEADRFSDRQRDLQDDINEYTVAHLAVHEAIAAEQKVIHDRFITDDLRHAETRGRLAFGLTIFNIIGREWRLIATILLALLAFAGTIRVEFAAH